MLPDTHDLDIPVCMKTLTEWTAAVKSETARCFHQFERAPHKYQNSEAYFRMMMLVTVIQQDFGVTYDPGCRDTFVFKSSRKGFIHGLLTGDRQGTCANMPVLYATIARNLGYPVYIVSAKSHFFNRWHTRDGRVRLNIEASARDRAKKDAKVFGVCSVSAYIFYT